MKNSNTTGSEAGREVLREVEREMRPEQQPRGWRSINGDQTPAPIAQEGFELRAFIRDRGVVVGIIACVAGVAVAGLAIYLPSGFWRMLGCIGGACVSFAGVSQITGYINRRTAYEAQNRPENRDFVPKKKKRKKK